MKTKSNRIFYYDFLRAFAIIAVIMCHMDIFYGSLTNSTLIIAKLTFHDIGRMGVPIFLMISGALLLNRDYTLSNFLKRRFSRIIYPFIFWMSVIIIGLICFKSSYSYIWNFFIGNPSITWYFWTLIGIYLFLPIINSFIRDYGEKGVKYFLIIWLVTVILQMFNRYPLFPDFNLNYFASYIGYPILGYYLSNKEFKMDNLKIIIIALVALIISLTTYVYFDFNQIGLISSIYLNIPVIIMTSSFFILSYKNPVQHQIVFFGNVSLNF